MASQLSVVVPILNEEPQLPELFQHLSPLSHHQIIFVDGGSDDQSTRLVQQAGFSLVQSEKGRARQMNAGAAMATGDIVLFLHADTRLPPSAEQLIIESMYNTGKVWGRFDARITGNHWLLPVVARMMSWRSRLTGIATGDQAIFIRRSVFNRLGGFSDIPLMEDIEISRRLNRESKPVCLRACVTTSGRRWMSRGVLRTIVLMWYLRFAYWRGVSPEKLASLYR